MDMQTAYAGYGARKVWHKEDRMRLSLPLYSLGEEIFSAVSHGVGALFGAAALVMLLWFCEKSLVSVVSVSIFGGTMILLYTVSTLYHALNVNRAKKVFRVLDHCTIYLLIAGTYTPITLCCIEGRQGIVMFAAVWAAAVLGIILNAVDMEKFKVVSMICYLMMGWVVVLAFNTVAANAGCGIKLPHRGRRGVHRRRGAVRPRQKSAVHARRVAPVCLSRQRAAYAERVYGNYLIIDFSIKITNRKD